MTPTWDLHYHSTQWHKQIVCLAHALRCSRHLTKALTEAGSKPQDLNVIKMLNSRSCHLPQEVRSEQILKEIVVALAG